MMLLHGIARVAKFKIWQKTARLVLKSCTTIQILLRSKTQERPTLSICVVLIRDACLLRATPLIRSASADEFGNL
jgi:hypothetical protein